MAASSDALSNGAADQVGSALILVLMPPFERRVKRRLVPGSCGQSWVIRMDRLRDAAPNLRSISWGLSVVLPHANVQ